MLSPVLTILYQIDPLNVSIGGIQTTVLNFIKYAPQDFDIRLIGISSRKDCSIGHWQKVVVTEKLIDFLPLFYIEDDNVRSLFPTTLKFFLALFGKRINSDFIHFHRIEPSLASFNWHGEKTLFIHADIYKQLNGPGQNRAFLWRYIPSVYFFLERILLKQFSYLLSCNSESLSYIKESYPGMASNCQLIRNTVDNEIFFSLSAQEKEDKLLQFTKQMKLLTGTRFISFVGRLHPQKDPLLLVRSVALLSNDIHLLIIGEGELKSDIQAEIENLRLSKRVTLLGGMSPKSIADILRISELLALTSIYEGLPIVVLEALACGIPVVSTDSGETSKLLSDETGVLISERTPEATADALNVVLRNTQSFPSRACAQSSKPYWAKTVVSDVYDKMRERWKDKHRLSHKVFTSV